MSSSSGFYRSVQRNNHPPSSFSQLEQKLDKIFDKVTEQGNQIVILKEKGEKTLDSITSLEDKLSTLEDKVNLIEQATTPNKEKKKESGCPIPPELSVIQYIGMHLDENKLCVLGECKNSLCQT